ncbi:MAG: HAMP domain-containing protein, partial [Methyloglobulus sp.]|nr:HAMP domain-containing protein [Methyloglobulus sp.]
MKAQALQEEPIQEVYIQEEDTLGERTEDETETGKEVENQSEPGLFSRLLLPQKFLILGFLGLMMALIPFGFYFVGMQNNIAITKKELNGIDPSIGILKLVQLTQQHRSLSSIVLEDNDAVTTNARYAKTKEITEAMVVMDALINGRVTNLSVVKEWNDTKQHWQTLLGKVKSNKISQAESVMVHADLIGEYFTLLERMTDVFGLALDPEASSYYLMSSSLYTMPKLAEALDRTSDLGTELLMLKKTDPARLAEIISFLSLTKTTQQEAFTHLQKSLDITANVKTALQSLTTKTLNRINMTVRLTESEIIKKQSQPLNYDEKAFNDDNKSAIISLQLLNTQALEQLKKLLQDRESGLINQLLSVGGGFIALLIISMFIAYLISLSVTRPVNQLVDVMQQLASGDSTVRSNIRSFDEIGVLAHQFDTMVDQRETVREKIQQENDTLNNSIINLLQAVAALAQRDLTVKAPVAEDVTGPVGDALNYLSYETAKVLNRVVKIAGDVSKVSQQVKFQSDTVINIAAEEKREVEQSATELSAASEMMLDIAKLALSCNLAAAKAIQNTDKAQETVLGTVQGITAIRDTIRETEKRIKRLGERSQEIGNVVTIINGIAERTHILALNASMHAASAGEAGRGFAVVANEVQKLAENAREATQ